ncbi:MAG: YceI family protein [Asticcacaulis sp.]
MKRLLVPLAMLALAVGPVAHAKPHAGKPHPARPAAAAQVALPAGDYAMDKPHASLTFTVSHMGFSHYTARFTAFDAHMKLDPAHPEKAQLVATIDPRSLELNAPPAGFHDELLGKSWFDAAAFPQWTFKSTKITRNGAHGARVTGDFTMHGATKPVTLDVVFNGGYPGMAGMDPHARIGFSAHGVLKRSQFGISYGIPAPGSNFGVGDDVNIAIEAEFTGPELKTK